MPPPVQSLASPESTGSAIVRRILASLGCSVLTAVMAAGQPLASFYLAAAAMPGLFGQYPLLAPLVVAVIGVAGGALVGLVAGAAYPSRTGAALALTGLAMIQLATLPYLFIFHVGPSEAAHLGFLVLTVPGILVNLTIAAGLAYTIRPSVL